MILKLLPESVDYSRFISEFSSQTEFKFHYGKRSEKNKRFLSLVCKVWKSLLKSTASMQFSLYKKRKPWFSLWQ